MAAQLRVLKFVASELADEVQTVGVTVDDAELLRSQVWRSSEEILSTHEAWRAAMMEKGWAE